MAARPKSNSNDTEFALIKQTLTIISAKITSMETALETKYAQATETALLRLEIAEIRKNSVTQDQYWPVKIIVFGAVGLILTSALGAILTLVITKGT